MIPNLRVRIFFSKGLVKNHQSVLIDGMFVERASMHFFCPAIMVARDDVFSCWGASQLVGTPESNKNHRGRFSLLGGGSKDFFFHPYLGKISNLTNIFRNIFQRGWNHQLVFLCLAAATSRAASLKGGQILSNFGYLGLGVRKGGFNYNPPSLKNTLAMSRLLYI